MREAVGGGGLPKAPALVGKLWPARLWPRRRLGCFILSGEPLLRTSKRGGRFSKKDGSHCGFSNRIGRKERPAFKNYQGLPPRNCS